MIVGETVVFGVKLCVVVSGTVFMGYTVDVGDSVWLWGIVYVGDCGYV